MKIAPSYFADTSFGISLLEEGDDCHDRAMAWQRRVVAEHNALVTTEPVMWELLNFFSAPPLRHRGLQLYRGAHNRREISVMDFDPDLCRAAITLYSNRMDKEWGVVDCFSFELMRIRGMKYALTADHHFEQAGLVALLLQDPSTFVTA